MDIFPAIDLRSGKCVRLVQGDYERQIDYSEDPVAQAKAFKAEGARWLHIVDLDGARDGTHFNLDTLLSLRQATDLHLQVGGGIRNERAVQNLLQIGIGRVVIGTRALQEPKWFEGLVGRCPERIVLGLDARDGKVATHGWTKTSDVTVEEMVRRVNDWPLAAIVYTDISRDGMLVGPNLEATRRLAENCSVPVIASGGVGELEHIRQLAQLPLAGIIIGRALYDKKFTLADAIAIVNET
ncbi:MAG: 1-(5-phosphoribosyl)-5-[(5-phosphoribosylamino)methylideneamino]imidazole-4-carboxamide isomerase [Sedimentisphaerales bacterium]|nr:1-(5-phosphoribosyl)-5-[(5-phosphoribosylamino)methylideneamino]imidazole-4-carboxamide isomerase [Sedimentisphaerales bacterium]